MGRQRQMGIGDSRNGGGGGDGGFLGGKDVVELGAGAAALPATVAAAACGARRVVATDLGSVVEQVTKEPRFSLGFLRARATLGRHFTTATSH